jgi:hypothetical protein
VASVSWMGIAAPYSGTGDISPTGRPSIGGPRDGAAGDDEVVDEGYGGSRSDGEGTLRAGYGTVLSGTARAREGEPHGESDGLTVESSGQSSAE